MTSESLPAQRICSSGAPLMDYGAVFSIAIPLMANSAVQILLSVVDTWFIGHISPRALAAVGAAQGLIFCIMTVVSGAATPVQPIVAMSFGRGQYTRAASAVWIALWSVLLITPIIVAIGLFGVPILKLFGLEPRIAGLAAEFWLPRIAGFPLGIASTAVLLFFYGIGRPGPTVWIQLVVVLANALFNQLFIFVFGWGVAGCGWASTAAQAVGLTLALIRFLNADCRRRYRSHLTWKPRARPLLLHFRQGLPMGMLPAADLIGSSVFQLMQVRLGVINGAATQLVAALETMVYVPGGAIASAGTTLVAQSLGAGNPLWAKFVGTRVILATSLVTGTTGLLIAMTGPFVLPFFVQQSDFDAAAVIALAKYLLWIAAAYQFFEGLNLGAIMCLRGVGDTTVPAILAILIACLIFLPLAHSFTFSLGAGWVHFLPQFGWGTVGGWVAVVIYVALVGSTLFVRWYSSPGLGATHLITR